MARYDSYLIRIWRSKRHGRQQTAIRIEHVQDGTCVQCAGIDEALTAIRSLLYRDPDHEGWEQAPDERTGVEEA